MLSVRPSFHELRRKRNKYCTYSEMHKNATTKKSHIRPSLRTETTI